MSAACNGCGQPAIALTASGYPICPDCADVYGYDDTPDERDISAEIEAAKSKLVDAADELRGLGYADIVDGLRAAISKATGEAK